ncbi:diguanylate cyclase [Pseudoalteromonas sp. SS15]|uniref:diguanylate cyclase n=1 Tax=Pseudoalteromonas sp. SS15 TaxID=3139393 RepID=UPI003BA9FFCA
MKLFLLFALLLIGFSSVHLLIRYAWTIPQFIELEVENDKKDIRKLGSAFSRIQSEMQRLIYDNAVWDEMIRVIKERDLAFLEENYHIPESLASLNLNGMHFYDVSGEPVSHFALENNGSVILDSVFQTAKSTQKRQFLIVKEPEIPAAKEVQFRSGIIQGKQHPVLYVSGSIVPSTGVGDVVGTMLVWTYLDEKISQQLSDLMQRQITLFEYSALPQGKSVIPFDKYQDYPHIRSSEQKIYISFNDVNGKASTVMAYAKPKRMFDDNLIEYSMGIALLSSILILALIYLLINKMVIIPLTSLRETVVKVIDQGNYSQATNIQRQDEIGRLASLIDGLFATVNSQQTILVEANKKLQKLSDTDELTNIANRRSLMHFLEMIEQQRELSLFPVSMIMLDIDHFKTYNDFYGHQAGDTVICQVAEVLSRNTRSNMDLVARYGGEEFTVVLTQVSKEEALLVANKLKQAIFDLEISHQKSQTAEYISASLGFTSCEQADGFDIEQLFRVADSALYEAKEVGRNSVISKTYQLSTTDNKQTR